MCVFFPAFLLLAGKARLAQTAILTVLAVGFISGITWMMTLRLPEGLVWSLFS